MAILQFEIKQIRQNINNINPIYLVAINNDVIYKTLDEAKQYLREHKNSHPGNFPYVILSSTNMNKENYQIVHVEYNDYCLNRAPVN